MREIGVVMSIQLNTGAPREPAELTIDPSGTIELVLGTMLAGQGHETSFAQVIAEWLGAEPDRVRLVNASGCSPRHRSVPSIRRHKRGDSQTDRARQQRVRLSPDFDLHSRKSPGFRPVLGQCRAAGSAETRKAAPHRAEEC